MTTFTATIEPLRSGGIQIKVPFDPDAEWGSKDRHDVTGSVGGHPVRGKLVSHTGAHYLQLGPAWCRDNPPAVGQHVQVELGPEGPQLSNVGADLAAALDASPAARRFFEGLPTFYRKNFVRWIDGAKRPETRAKRIQETIATLEAGKRER
jgi:hypothetical protein